MKVNGFQYCRKSLVLLPQSRQPTLHARNTHATRALLLRQTARKYLYI